MKQEVVLKGLYKTIFDDEFNYFEFDKRLIMQKATYILKEMGLNVGDYGFSWYKHGPYSQALQEDAYRTIDVKVPDGLTLTSFAKDIIAKFKKIITEKPDEYSLSKWLEAVASLHYIKNHRIFLDCDDNEIIDKLMTLKPHLSDRKINFKALKIADSIN